MNITNKKKCESIARTSQVHAGLVIKLESRLAGLALWAVRWLYLDTS